MTKLENDEVSIETKRSKERDTVSKNVGRDDNASKESAQGKSIIGWSTITSDQDSERRQAGRVRVRREEKGNINATATETSADERQGVERLWRAKRALRKGRCRGVAG